MQLSGVTVMWKTAGLENHPLSGTPSIPVPLAGMTQGNIHLWVSDMDGTRGKASSYRKVWMTDLTFGLVPDIAQRALTLSCAPGVSNTQTGAAWWMNHTEILTVFASGSIHRQEQEILDESICVLRCLITENCICISDWALSTLIQNNQIYINLQINYEHLVTHQHMRIF